MDPRHPELAINRVKELSEQFDRVLDDIRNETISNKLGGLEREGSLVVQELCLIAPRLHEAMMQVSRNRRRELSRGNIDDLNEAKRYFEEKVEEQIGSKQAETVIVEPKPRKKKSTKKKKKAE